MAPAFFCCAAVHFVYHGSAPFHDAPPPRLHIPSISLLPAARHAFISRPFPCARRPPRQFLALRVKSPARRKRRSERQIQGHRPHIPPIFISCMSHLFTSIHFGYTAPRITALRRSAPVSILLVCKIFP